MKSPIQTMIYALASLRQPRFNPLLQHRAYAPQPNCRFNADANKGHRFAILMALVGALQPSASGAG